MNNIFFLILMLIDFLALGINLAKDGEQRTDKYSFLTAFIGTSIQLILVYLAIRTGF